MLSTLRKHVTYANVVLTIALVFAMTGGAYAASKYLITSTKQISPKVLKSLQGKTGTAGAKGATGSTGPAGPAGLVGSVGATGGAGKEGATGKEGPQGKPGETGEPGKEGSPWTAGGTLPSGKSEYGTWSTIYVATAADQPDSASISYTIPLESTPEVHYIGTSNHKELAGEEHEAAGLKEGKCKGNSEKPEAAPGNLCVFAALEIHATEWLRAKVQPIRFAFAAPDGAVVTQASEMQASEVEGEVLATGTWVVTAAE